VKERGHKLSLEMSVALPNALLDPAPVLTKAVRRAAERLALSQRELAGILGVSEATVSRLAKGAAEVEPHSKTGELALLFLRAFRSLDAVFGGDTERVKLWLKSANAHVGGVPAERMQRVEGLVNVVEYLDTVRGKL
jgi:DNA-binding XRE family transcriptional regulator